MSADEIASYTQASPAVVPAGTCATTIRELQRALRADPLDYDAYLQLGRILSAQGRHESARQLLSRLARKLRDDPEVHEALSDVLAQLGCERESLSALRHAVSSDPDNERLVIKLARLLAASNYNRKAAGILKRFLRFHPQAADAACELGYMYLEWGCAAKAHKQFQQCLHHAPDHRRAKEGLNRVVRSVALSMGNASRETNSDDSHGMTQRCEQNPAVAAIQALNDGRPDEAIVLLEHAIHQDAPAAETHMLLGIAYRDSRRYEEASAVFERLIQSDQDKNMARFQLAVTYNLMRRHDQARQLLNLALTEDPNFAEAYFELGLALYGLNNKEGAAHCLARAIAAGYDDEEPYVKLASLYVEMGYLDHAENVAAECLSRHSDCAAAHVIIAHVHVARERWDVAEAAAGAALRCNPNHLIARKYLAIALWEQGREERARPLLAHLRDTIPNDPLLVLYYEAAGL